MWLTSFDSDNGNIERSEERVTPAMSMELDSFTRVLPFPAGSVFDSIVSLLSTHYDVHVCRPPPRTRFRPREKGEGENALRLLTKKGQVVLGISI